MLSFSLKHSKNEMSVTHVFLGFWFVQQALYSIASLGTNAGVEGGIAYWAHAGGFAFGAILGPLMGLFANKE